MKEEVEELTRQGLPVNFTVGDIVLVPNDISQCQQSQIEDPMCGWWNDDMSGACGLEGQVTEVKTQDDRVGCVRVLSRGRHKLQNIEKGERYF